MHERTVETPSGGFRYLSAGPEDAPLVLCLHGFPDHPPTFTRLCLDMVARAGLRVAAPWLRGYHPSVSHGPFTLERLVEDVLDIARALSPQRPIHLVGHDWGAAIAYPALTAAPERFLSAVTMAVPHPLAFLRALGRDPGQMRRSWYMFFFQVPGVPERVIPRRDFRFIDRLWASWSPGYSLPDHERRALHACLAASMPGPIEYYRAMTRPFDAAVRRIRDNRGQRITVPTLHLHGERDQCIAYTAARGQERWFAGPFASEIVPEVGHFMHAEAPGAVAERVVAWCARHSG